MSGGGQALRSEVPDERKNRILESARKIYGLDTLRIFALGIIVLYHFFPTRLPAGFLGVNLFFVLSGFLATHHALNEIAETGAFSKRRFYEKRLRRIFPSLFLLLLMGIVLVNFAPPDYRVAIDKQTAAAFSFSTNWYEILSGGSYEAQFIPHIFVHTWFLAIEIHFYLAFPLLLSLLLQFGRKKGGETITRNIFMLSVFFYLTSLVASFIGQANFTRNLSWLYFSDFTRFSSFFVGMFLAAYRRRMKKRYCYLPSFTLLCYALLAILAIIFRYESRWTYLVGFPLTDFLAAFLIWNYANENEKKEPNQIQAVATSSYGIYLFHWPLLVMVPTFVRGASGYFLVVVATAAMLLLDQMFWEPLLLGKKNLFRENRQKRRNIHDRPYSWVLTCAALFILTAGTHRRAPAMLSLQKLIWEKSVQQDVEKIQMDFQQLSEQRADVIAAQQVEDNGDGLVINDVVANGITVIGDSVLLGPRDYIMAHLPKTFVDAEGYRLAEMGAEVIERLKKEGKLGSYVVIALGTNAVEDRKEALRAMARAVPDETRLIFVTPYDENVGMHEGSAAMKAVAQEFDYITVMDWEAYVQDNPELYEGTDGIHFYGREGTYAAYVTQLKRAILEAAQGPAKESDSAETP